MLHPTLVKKGALKKSGNKIEQVRGDCGKEKHPEATRGRNQKTVMRHVHCTHFNLNKNLYKKRVEWLEQPMWSGNCNMLLRGKGAITTDT